MTDLTTLAPGKALSDNPFTTPVILVVSLTAYLLVVAILLIIKEILVSKGKCTSLVCPCCANCCVSDPANKNDCLGTFCLGCAEFCNCCGPPDVATAQWWDQCCARRKGGIDCYDIILCQCCNDCGLCQEVCCDSKNPLCNCQGCGCEAVSCQCQAPECQKIDCCCCEIQLKGGQQYPGGYPPPGYGGYGGGYGNDYSHGYDNPRYGDLRGPDNPSERWDGGRGGGPGSNRWGGESASRGRDLQEGRGLPMRTQPSSGNPFLASGVARGGDGDGGREWGGRRNNRYDRRDDGDYSGSRSGGYQDSRF